ncbi:MAG: filamentous hemagglutinin N-terminal domain-containing protein [Nitrospinales bacterium]
MKRLLVGTLVVLLGCISSLALALPSGENVSGGSATFSRTDPTYDLLINQGSSKVIINWDNFDINPGESVHFSQSVSDMALNKIGGNHPTSIFGSLSGGGQIWIVNPNGVFFGPGATVDAHGIFASTLDISEQDFLDGHYNFSPVDGKSLTSIINEGIFNVTGYVGLLAPTVINRGRIIVANLGSVALGSAKAATVDFTGDGLINFVLTEGVDAVVFDHKGNVVESGVTNSETGTISDTGFIQANGGQVSLTAKDAGGVIRSVVNNEGVIEANTVVEKEGKIILSGSSLVKSSGRLSASGDDEGEKAGTIEIYGENVELLASEIAESGNEELFALQAFDSIEEPRGVLKAETNVNGEGDSGLLRVEATNSILVEQDIETTGKIEMLAYNDINIYGALVSGGIGTNEFYADYIRDGTGDFFLGSDGSISTGKNDLEIRASDIDLRGNLNGRNIIVRVSDGGTIGFDGGASSSEKSTICGEECGMTVSQSEIDKMNARHVNGNPAFIEFGDGSAGAITVDDINLSSNLFKLQTGGTINDIDDGDPNITTSSDLILVAGGDIGNLGGPDGDGLNVDVKEVRFSNGSNDNFRVTNENSSGEDQSFGAVTDGTGNISYTLKNGNLLVDLVSTQGDVNLEATTGSILDGNDVNGPDNPDHLYLNVKADTATLTALSGIGEEGNRLETDVNTLNASTTGPNGNIYMHENDAIFLNNINTAGTFDIIASGNITEGTVNADLIKYNGTEQNIIQPEQEEDIDQGTTSTFIDEFFENVADNC